MISVVKIVFIFFFLLLFLDTIRSFIPNHARRRVKVFMAETTRAIRSSLITP